jgi:2,4-dienoyl-CoA reductase-like NADH-dependent reductase (Old Yellow Enzyme family)
VGPDFPVGIKLNSSDFQVGGFTHAECLEIVRWLNDFDLDLLELSGGSLEQPKIVGVALKDEGIDGQREKDARREAYFVHFAGSIRALARMPVMVTGGFRTATVMAEAIAAGDLDVVGLGRPMLAEPRTPAKLLSGEIQAAPTPEDSVHVLHLIPWFSTQLVRLGAGLDPDLSLSGEAAAARFRETELQAAQALAKGRLA